MTTMDQQPKTTAAVAMSYLHETEIPGNMGFKDAEFEKKMKDVGFHPSYAWCALFLELCCKEGAPEFYAKHEAKFSPSAVTTFNNFKAAGLTTDKPQIGYGVCWKHGAGPTGHAGVVVGIKNLETAGTFSTAEGNSNSDGSREGYEVAYKPDRKLNKPYNPAGLNLLGFIKIE